MFTKSGLASLDRTVILEVGCGTGFWVREFIKWGARPENITGIDLMADRIAEARELSSSKVNFYCSSAAQLDLPDDSFDLVSQSLLFTSVLDLQMKRQIASEMLRVVKKEGLIVWYDFYYNNPWNPEVRGIGKKDVYRLFPECQISLRRITLAPPVARWLAPRSWLLCSLLERIPWLCTHYLGLIRKPAVCGSKGGDRENVVI